MKVFLLMVVSIVGVQAVASPLPSVLPDGKYFFECQTLTVKKDDERGMVRDVIFTQGTSVVISSGDQTTTKEISTSKGEDGKVFGTYETVTQSTLKSLSNNQYEEQITSVTRWADEASKVQESKMGWRRVVEVTGNFEINLKVQRDGESEKPGVGETYTNKVMDGVYLITGYNREGYRQERRDLGNGFYILGSYIYQKASTCKYTIK